MAAWATRRYGATIVYWLDDGALELTVDDDLEQAITIILRDVAPAGCRVPPADSDLRAQPGVRSEHGRYGDAVDEPVITRIVAIEDPPAGIACHSAADRRLVGRH